MEARTVKITVTDTEGTVLDTATVEVTERFNKIAFRAVDYSIGRTADEEILQLGDVRKLP
jgi:hypothetical protein